MTREMFINAVVPENIRVAILENGRLEAYFEETEERSRTRGNIYLGRITNAEHSLEACFVEYGEARHGFLPFSEIHLADEEAQAPRKELKRGMPIVVQVDKEPIGSKGARLTSYISLAGRYLVLMPNSKTRGVSRRIEDEDRQKTKEIGADLAPPPGMGFIIRTAGLGRGKRELSQDLNYLVRLWKDIEGKAKRSSQPGLLHAEADIVSRVLRDYYTNEIGQVWIDDPGAFSQARGFFKLFMPRQQEVLREYTGALPIFSNHGIEEQIEAIYQRRVPLPSGGSLVIEQTEALVSIDVNSGKTKNPKGQEETAFETNLEAASEVARQLRLRDLGGIVVIDFIDMTQAEHNTALERALKEALKPDKARHEVGKISAFGLCTLTRQRLGQSTLQLGYQDCPTCGGDGVVRSSDSVAVRLLRRLQTEAAKGLGGKARVRLHPELANHIQNHHRAELHNLEHSLGWVVEIEADVSLSRSVEQFELLPAPAEPHHKAEPPAPKPKKPEPTVPRSAAPVPAEARPEGGGRPRHRRRRRRKNAQQPGVAAAVSVVAPAPAQILASPSTPAPTTSPVPQLSLAPGAMPPKPSGHRRRRRRRHKKRPPELKPVAQ